MSSSNVTECIQCDNHKNPIDRIQSLTVKGQVFIAFVMGKVESLGNSVAGFVSILTRVCLHQSRPDLISNDTT